MQIINIDLPVHTYNEKNYNVESQTLRLDSNGENTIGWVFAKKMEEGKTKCFLYEKLSRLTSLIFILFDFSKQKTKSKA